MLKKTQLQSVHFLRATASVLVCVYHLFCGNTNLFPASVTKNIFSYGYLGVEMFFMLSGFIICYAFPIRFSYGNLKPFLIKRLVRIEPPYIASILLVIILNTISHKITNQANHIDWTNLLLHFAYLNNFGYGQYINIIYWTLGIEFQFYLIIAIIFPLVKNNWSLFSILTLFVAISCIPIPSGILIISPFLSIFGLGILVYFYQIKKQMSTIAFAIAAAFQLLQVYLYLGLSESLACIFTLLVLLFWEYQNRLISFFSAISFSLYLTHTIIGGKVINLGLRFVDTIEERYMLFATALLISITFAYIFYLIVEKPSMALSKKIYYRNFHAS